MTNDLLRLSIKKFLLVLFIFVASVVAIQSLSSQKVHAAYDGGRLIDNSVFLDAQSMSAAQIQSFLVSKGAGLANMSFVLNCYGSDSKERQWYTAVGAACDTSMPASHIIFYAAQIYGVNPKVILATMQKEQSLTTAPNPTSWQINQAMGYACPTSGQCGGNSTFPYQIDSGTWVLRYHYERARGNLSWWTPSSSWTCGSAKNYYTPNLYPNQNVNFYDQNGVMYRTLFIFNAATSAFYCYTPHTYNNPAGQFGLPQYGTTGMYYSGSYNFVRFFELWFGTTTGANYAWNIEDFTYSGGDNIIPQGQTETITLRARNIGLVPWYNHGSSPVKLATWEPAGRTSSLFPTRLATLTESVVMPNEVGTFTFQVTPQSLGTFYESLNLVAENNAWMHWPGFRPTIVVPQAYQWQIQAVSYEKGTGMMDPGSTQLITVIAKNTGSMTWSKSNGIPIRIGTWQPQRQSGVASGWISSTRAVEMNESSVAPGQNAGFQFYVRMPNTGPQYERLNLVAEGHAWFNDVGLTLYLHGNDYAWALEGVQYGAGTGVMQPGSSQTITVRARNTGTATWKNNGDYPIKLGTWLPQRQSALSEDWESPTRMVTLTEASVAPGQIGTFTADVKMPSTGLYYEHMNLVAEGIKWFNPGVMFYLEGRN